MTFAITPERSFEVAVIGGGLVGAATAYGLAGLGLKTAMLDEGDIAFRAARGNTTLVWVQGKGANFPAYTAWTVEAALAWPGFAADLKDVTGIDVNYQRSGGLKFCLGEQEFEERSALISRIDHSDRQATTEMLGRDALLDIYPGLGPQVVGASYNPMDGQVDSLLLIRALHAGYQNRGGHYLPHHGVEDIRHDQGSYVLSGGGGEIRAEKILLAAGIANGRLAEKAGLYGGVKPIRGQVLVSEKVRPCLPVPATDLVQTDAGGLLIGNIEEDAGYDESTHLDALSGMARRAVATFPFLEAVQIVRAWGALRVMTEDGNPIYHQSETSPAAFCASTHSGVTLASLHATTVARWVAGKDPGAELAAFHPERFHVH
ncbi:MAG: FAD-binding oxidoreductase [Rhodospirillales bacterium]|nr:FAD-binding oxidoreductase [Rhodospirillales bacterium]